MNTAQAQASSMGDRMSAGVQSKANQNAQVGLQGAWEFECFDRDGNLKWKDKVPFNLLVDEGLNDILDKYFKGSAYTAAHYIGLTDGTPTVAAGDTMSSHAGWAEVHSIYSESNRPAFTPGTVASKSVDNSANKASFTVTGTGTAGGAFLSTNNTKNGTTGILVSAGAFSQGDKALDSGDTVNVQTTYTASST